MVGEGTNVLQVGGLIDGTEVCEHGGSALGYERLSCEADLYCDTENRIGLDVFTHA